MVAIAISNSNENIVDGMLWLSTGFFQLILLLYSTYYVPCTIPAVTFMVIIISHRHAAPHRWCPIIYRCVCRGESNIGTIKHIRFFMPFTIFYNVHRYDFMSRHVVFILYYQSSDYKYNQLIYYLSWYIYIYDIVHIL